MTLPDRIGRYTILGRLGEGAMGAVYLGRDDDLDREVALKVMTRGEKDQDARARFLREARAAARLQHPNIIVIYELGEHEGAPYMALEYLEGVDLQRGIDAGVKPDPRFTLPIVLQVLAGLGHAHDHGIVHRDVKPSNIFLPLGGPAKVTDFGVARLAGHNVTTTSGVVSGTPSYMSPEQVQGGEIDGRSDLFSVALILYELVTGERAFRAETVVAVFFKVLHEEVDLTLIPPGDEWDKLRKVIARGMTRPREQRYPDARSMAADLAAALQDLGGSVDGTAPADQALLVRPKITRPRPPAHPAPGSPPPRPRPAAAHRPGGRASVPPPRATARRPLALAGALGGGALLLLAVAAWLVLRPAQAPPATGPEPEPSASARVENEAAPAAKEPTKAPTEASPAATLAPSPVSAATPATTSTPAPSPPPTPAPPPTPEPSLTVEQRLARATALMEEKRFAQALAEARAVLRDQPTHPEATALAQAAEAAVVLEECIANATAALEAGDRDRALAEVRRGFAVKSNDPRLVELFRRATRD